MENIPQSGAHPEQPEGEVRIINGKKYRRVDSGYTIRQYFSHSTPEKGPGPGWDSRWSLADEEDTKKEFGRTFSLQEVGDPTKLPDDPYYVWELTEEESK
ncbi:MAG: hypothetical protein Q8L24_02925 [bacterium]|nr:hypothetical protein [bacterium]